LAAPLDQAPLLAQPEDHLLEPDALPEPSAATEPVASALDHADERSAAEKARELLGQLSATEGFRGLGVFDAQGKVVSSLVSEDVDIASLGSRYSGLIKPLKDAMLPLEPSPLRVVRFEAAAGIYAIVSFEPLFVESGLEATDALSFVSVVLSKGSAVDQILETTISFMRLIVADLNKFRTGRSSAQ